MPIVIAFRKSRRAQDKEDYETWVESGTANTINTFDGGGETRATTIVVNENSNGEEIRRISRGRLIVYDNESDRDDSRPSDTEDK